MLAATLNDVKLATSTTNTNCIFFASDKKIYPLFQRVRNANKSRIDWNRRFAAWLMSSIPVIWCCYFLRESFKGTERLLFVSTHRSTDWDFATEAMLAVYGHNKKPHLLFSFFASRSCILISAALFTLYHAACLPMQRLPKPAGCARRRSWVDRSCDRLASLFVYFSSLL